MCGADVHAWLCAPPTLLQGDLWQFYDVPSLFGQEVVTLGGPRGPAASYYLPYLSAVQLFVPAGGEECQHQQGTGAEAVVYKYAGGLDEWPAEMRLQYQWFASGHVGERIPLQAQLDVLAGAAGASHVLFSTKIADLHPYSW